MTRASSLPEQLRYLQPFRKKFASRPPEELNEDSGMKPLLALFSKRIQGHDDAAAEKLVEEDLAVLKGWLSEPAQQSDPLHFALGVFYIFSPAELVKHIREEAENPPEPKLCLHLNLPPGAKLRKVKEIGEVGVLAVWEGLLFFAQAQSEEVAAKMPVVYARAQHGIELAISPVQFGEVSGTKFIATEESWRGPYKKVDYLLAVPGGNVHSSISPFGKKVDELHWDESKVETFFHTLRVTLKLPPTK